MGGQMGGEGLRLDPNSPPERPCLTLGHLDLWHLFMQCRSKSWGGYHMTWGKGNEFTIF